MQNMAGGRPGTPRGSKAANRQLLGKGLTASTSSGKGALQLAGANRGRFFPAATVPLGTPAAATATQRVADLSPKLNYRMAPAPESEYDDESSPAAETRGTLPDKKSSKGPVAMKQSI